jgi:hypothetical protein
MTVVMNNELYRTRQDLVVLYFKVLFQYLHVSGLKMTVNYSHKTWSVDQDSNLEPSEYEVGILTTG